MKISKSGLIMLIVGLLAVGFASVSTTLILTGTVSIGVNKDDFEVVFASANIDGGHANISKTDKKGDTLTFSTPDISKVDEPVVLNYTVKNNSTQYGADVSIKCYAVNDTNHYLNDYITLTGIFGSQNITFGVDEASSSLSGSETIAAQGILSGSITVNLNKPFLDSEGNDGKLSIACMLSASASEQTSAGVRPANTLASNTEIDDIKGNLKSFTKVTGKNYDYEAVFDEGTEEVALDVKTKNIYSDVYVGKVEDTSTLSSISDNYQVNLLGVSLLTGSNIEYTKNLTISVVGGENYYKIKVVSEDGTAEAIYTIKIKVQQLRLLNRAILDDNTLVTAAPTLTNTSAATGEKGLYSSTATNSGEPTYYFRGNITNNWVDFANFRWRIIRINEDGTIRLIMEDGINNNYAKYKYHTSDNLTGLYFTNGTTSGTAKFTLDNWYEENITNNGFASHVMTGNYFCEQAKVKAGTKHSAGNAAMTIYSSYTPTFKCETDGNGKGLVNTNVALITYDETVFSGLYHVQMHYNNSFLSGSATGASVGYITMSPAGIASHAEVWEPYADKTTTPKFIIYSGWAYKNNFILRPVINLRADTKVTGTGESTDHYVVQ